ncbi:protein PRR14L-like isoform X2 [Cephus cinctus]|uniref:Protein PRR14L-like isoform X2 n=1 Tax=Cephus cinctus TaxID=211228 RepID=A0AAJ7C9T1_CEPCN|nr:protein PRR14L-like isoform X2 [Cephus cinctus]
MEEKNSDSTKHIPDIVDSNLPEVMASLQMLNVTSNVSSPSSNKRVLRRRLPRPVAAEILNRRCSLKPKKRRSSEIESEDDIREYYLDKSIKKKPNCLETIFEENEDTNENTHFMSAKRFKRMIQFQQEPTDSKLKKRRAKVKKVFGSKAAYKHKYRRHTMQTLLDKLNGIRSESPVNVNTDIK